MYLPGEDHQVGHGAEPGLSSRRLRRASSWVIDMTQAVADVASGRLDGVPAHAASARRCCPTARVLATGGSRNSDVDRPANAVLAAELWDPATETWTHACRAASPAALPLDRDPPARRPRRARGWRRPAGLRVDEYRSGDLSRRPTSSRARGRRSRPRRRRRTTGRASSSRRRTGATIAKVALIPQPAVTHANNSNSGYIPLTFSQTAGGLTVTGPANGNIAPPGILHAVRRQRERRAIASPRGCASPPRAAAACASSLLRGDARIAPPPAAIRVLAAPAAMRRRRRSRRSSAAAPLGAACRRGGRAQAVREALRLHAQPWSQTSGSAVRTEGHPPDGYASTPS